MRTAYPYYRLAAYVPAGPTCTHFTDSKKEVIDLLKNYCSKGIESVVWIAKKPVGRSHQVSGKWTWYLDSPKPPVL